MAGLLAVFLAGVPLAALAAGCSRLGPQWTSRA